MNQYPFWIGLVFVLAMVSIMPNPVWWMVVALGIGANGLVVAANGWKMPVRGSFEETIRHAPMIPGTRHKWLGDVIPTGLGKASIGDFFLAAGLLGTFATRSSLTYVNLMILLCLVWWGSGWSKGFCLFDKWTSEARRDCRKNLPIVLLLMIVGNFLHVRGCSIGELHASVKNVEAALSPDKQPKIKSKTQSNWRDLGMLTAPPATLLKRLREANAKQEQDSAKEAALKVSVTDIRWNFWVAIGHKSARTGPFCRVTCTGCHGKWDVETRPEYCRADWIPPNATAIPGWMAISEKDEEERYWAGPAQAKMDYKLYWSELQGEAKTLVKP